MTSRSVNAAPRLTLDEPSARATLGACCALLRRWASEARANEQETTRRDKFGDRTRPAATETDTAPKELTP